MMFQLSCGCQFFIVDADYDALMAEIDQGHLGALEQIMAAHDSDLDHPMGNFVSQIAQVTLQ
jgi:hypothetical protein